MIPNDIDTTVMGPPRKIGPVERIIKSCLVTYGSLRIVGCKESASANVVDGDLRAFR